MDMEQEVEELASFWYTQFEEVIGETDDDEMEATRRVRDCGIWITDVRGPKM